MYLYSHSSQEINQLNRFSDKELNNKITLLQFLSICHFTETRNEIKAITDKSLEEEEV